MDGKSLNVTQRGWLRKAVALILSRTNFSVTMSGSDGAQLFHLYQGMAEKMPEIHPFGRLPTTETTVATPNIPAIPVKAAVAVLAAVGAEIGAGGSMAFVATYAKAHNAKVRFSFDEDNDNAFRITMTW